MTYKKKITVLVSIAAALMVVLLLTFIFDPRRMGSRSDAYSWLQPRDSGSIYRITISTTNDETIELVREENLWLVSQEGRQYPARRFRVEDLISALTRRASYPVRSTNAASHMRLSLTEGMAAQISVTDREGLPLLNLLVGHGDITGQNVYLRRQGHNEVRSGQDIFSAYTDASLTSWFNLLLFPETENGSLNAAGVQRLIVYPPAGEYEDIPSPLIFTRSGRDWDVNIDHADPDRGTVEMYIRNILGTMGDNFIDTIDPLDPMFNDSRITLELEDGSMRSIRLGPADDNGRRPATVTGTRLVYSIPAWAVMRLFPDTGFFDF